MKNLKELYFVQKDFIGYPTAIISATYTVNKGIYEFSMGNGLCPQKIDTTKHKSLFFEKEFNTDGIPLDMKMYEYCKCDKLSCDYNAQYRKLIEKLESKELKMDDFFSAISSPPMQSIFHYVSSAVYLAKDGKNFSNNEAKWFIKNIVEQVTDKDILERQKENDDENDE
jgi:hypothetical protein